MPQLCPNYAPTMPQPCPNYASTIPAIFHSIFRSTMPELCPNYAPTMPSATKPQLCPNYAFSPNYAPTMPQLCPDFAPSFAPTTPQLCFGRLPTCRIVNTKTKKTPKMNKIAHISVYDNRKSDFTEKLNALYFLNVHMKFDGEILNFVWQNLERCRQIKKGLSLKSGRINKVPEQLYIDSVYFK